MKNKTKTFIDKLANDSMILDEEESKYAIVLNLETFKDWL